MSDENNLERLAIDIAHYRQVPYFSVVDCGPGNMEEVEVRCSRHLCRVGEHLGKRAS